MSRHFGSAKCNGGVCILNLGREGANTRQPCLKAGGSGTEEDVYDHIPAYYYEHDFDFQEGQGSEETVEQKLEKKLETKNSDSLESEIKDAIANKNWDNLVQIVLEGHGDQLTDIQTTDAEVQDFLDNIPAFQEKIVAINKAIENGSLKELQNQLDRKKFALAKDRNTGVSFLHKAIVLRRTDIVRYLATNFPKILDLADVKGRTCLHYAAAANDGGHFYKLLIKTGANKELQDEDGHTPEFYLKNKDNLFLKDAQDMVEQSEYKPKKTRKSRKSNLTKKSNQQGSNLDLRSIFDEAYDTSDYEDEHANEVVDSSTVQKLEVFFRRLTWAKESKSLLKRFLTKKVFERLQRRATPQGGTLVDVIQSGVENMYSVIGVYACDGDAYATFWPLFKPIISTFHEIQGVQVVQPPSKELNPDNVGDFDNESIKFVQIEARRSLAGSPLQPRMTVEHYREMEENMGRVFEKLAGEFLGIYHSLNDITVNVRKHLEDMDAIFNNDDEELEAANIYGNWPVGRGVFVSQSRSIVIFLNESDHLKVRVRLASGKIGSAFMTIMGCLGQIEGSGTDNQFIQEEKIGFVTMSPVHLGTGLKVTVRLEIADIKAVEDLISQFNLTAEAVDEKTFDISNKFTFGLTEKDIFEAIRAGTEAILQKITSEK